jgi:hypothetical protein
MGRGGQTGEPVSIRVGDAPSLTPKMERDWVIQFETRIFLGTVPPTAYYLHHGRLGAVLQVEFSKSPLGGRPKSFE